MNELTKVVTIERYTHNDIPAMLDGVQAFLSEERILGYTNHFYGIDFDRQKLYTLLDNRERDPLFFTNLVKNERGEILGGLCGSVHSFIFSNELVAKDYLLYFTPSFANLTVLLALINSYVDWAKSKGVREVQLCSSTGFKQDKFGKLMKLCGFDQFEVGYARRF